MEIFKCIERKYVFVEFDIERRELVLVYVIYMLLE